MILKSSALPPSPPLPHYCRRRAIAAAALLLAACASGPSYPLYSPQALTGTFGYGSLQYGVNRENESLPTMNLTVISRRPVGLKKVYDIQVDEVHSFLANGIVSHNCMISHGASKFTRGRMYDASDKYQVHACRKCGLIASYNDEMHIHHCRTCDNRTDFAYVEIPYACKLLFQELITMNIAPRVITNY